jgi:predicted nucleotide-binding protein
MSRAPALFIGSSSEGLAVAQAIQTQLQHDTEVTVWNEGAFPLGQTTLEGIVNALDRFDFAVLVLTPDDRHDPCVGAFGPRDNLLFEVGYSWEGWEGPEPS